MTMLTLGTLLLACGGGEDTAPTTGTTGSTTGTAGTTTGSTTGTTGTPTGSTTGATTGTATGTTTATTPPAPDGRAVVVSTDYVSGGSLSTIDLDDWSIAADLAEVSTDPTVLRAGDHLLVLEGWGHDAIQVFDPDDLTAPVAVVELDAGANPRDAALCGDTLVVSQYGSAELLLLDTTTWEEVGTIPLDAVADADGLPEAETIARVQDGLVVAMQRYDTTAGWAPLDGRVVRLDCAKLAITDTWTVGATPRVFDYPLDDRYFVLVEGDDGTGKDVGGIGLFDSVDGTPVGTRVESADLGNFAFSDYAGTGAAGVYVASNLSTGASEVGCITWGGDGKLEELTPILSGPTWMVRPAANDRNEVWISGRTGWGPAQSLPGVYVVSGETCTELTKGSPILLAMEPYGIAFVP